MDSYIVNIDNFVYRYSSDGGVLPLLKITPIIINDNDNVICIDQIPLVLMDNNSDFNLAIGDEIILTVVGVKILIKLNRCSQNERVDVRITRCPVCHRPLANHNGLLYCLNCDCKAQLDTHIKNTFAILGITFEGVNLKILKSVIARLLVWSPADIFWLSVEQICSEDVSPIEAQTFQQLIHSVRGNVSLDRFFRSLNILGMTEETIAKICNLMVSCNFNLLDVPKLMVVSFINAHPEIDWSSWLEYISCENNRVFVTKLSNILYI